MKFNRKRVAIISENEFLNDVKFALDKFNIDCFEIVDEPPFDIIIPYGGDGTLLLSERNFPGIPKLPIRCFKEYLFDYRIFIVRDTIKKFLSDELLKLEYLKLECKSEQFNFFALNDILLLNQKRTSAIRCRVIINNDIYIDEDIGEGLVISTSYGSGSYFNSITNCLFHTGIGIAFNNSMKHTSHIIINEHSKIEIKLIRGPALLTFDNSNDLFSIDLDHAIHISRSLSNTIIYGLKEFRNRKID